MCFGWLLRSLGCFNGPRKDRTYVYLPNLAGNQMGQNYDGRLIKIHNEHMTTKGTAQHVHVHPDSLNTIFAVINKTTKNTRKAILSSIGPAYDVFFFFFFFLKTCTRNARTMA